MNWYRLKVTENWLHLNGEGVYSVMQYKAARQETNGMRHSWPCCLSGRKGFSSSTDGLQNEKKQWQAE